jgi:hypothetical protein
MSEKTTPTGRIMLKNVRLAFPALFEASAVDSDAKPRYSAAFIMPQDHPQLPELRKAMIAAAKAKWKDDAETEFKTLEKKDRLCIHDGDDKAKYAGYKGNLYVSAARQETDGRPTVIDADRTPLTAKDGRLYAGCYVNASIEVWAQESKQYGNRINAALRGVQFLRDGEAFGGSGAADADEFEDASEGAGSGDFA